MGTGEVGMKMPSTGSAAAARMSLEPFAGDEGHAPHARPRIFDRHHSRELDLPLAEEEIGHLLDAGIDVSDQRQPADGPLDPVPEEAADAGRQELAQQVEQEDEQGQETGDGVVGAEIGELDVTAQIRAAASAAKSRCPGCGGRSRRFPAVRSRRRRARRRCGRRPRPSAWPGPRQPGLRGPGRGASRRWPAARPALTGSRK